MSFTFRGNNLTEILGAPLGPPDALSVCGMVRKHCQAIDGDINTLWTGFRGNTPAKEYRKVETPFAALEGWWGLKYGDGHVINSLYNADAHAASALFLENSASTAIQRFNRARDRAFPLFTQGVATDTLVQHSFTMTYLHKDIERVFILHKQGDGHAIDPVALQSRVSETARIMLRILWGNMNTGWGAVYETRSILTTVLLATMHNKLLRNDGYKRGGRFSYCQSSVAFTLLTFSHLIASALTRARHEFHQRDWYYFWGILGSSLGLQREFIPDTYDEAEALWTTFRRSSETHSHLNQVDQDLLRSYNDDQVSINLKDIYDWLPAILRKKLPEGLEQHIAVVALAAAVKAMRG